MTQSNTMQICLHYQFDKSDIQTCKSCDSIFTASRERLVLSFFTNSIQYHLQCLLADTKKICHFCRPPPNSMAEDPNEILIEKAAKFGKYHILLFSIVFAILLLARSNEVFMIFGAYIPANFSCDAILNHSAEEFEFKSFVNSWSLCDGLDYVPTLMTSIQLSGSLISGVITGPVSDHHGRRITLIISATFLALAAIGSMAANSWQVQQL